MTDKPSLSDLYTAAALAMVEDEIETARQSGTQASRKAEAARFDTLKAVHDVYAAINSRLPEQQRMDAAEREVALRAVTILAHRLVAKDS